MSAESPVMFPNLLFRLTRHAQKLTRWRWRS
jgi:hypothetical protein